MSTAIRTDPVLAYNFQLSLFDSTSSTGAPVTQVVLAPLRVDPVAGFTECSGLEMSLELEEYSEGGNNGTVLKFPKRAKWGDLTLKRGLTKNTALFDWYYGFTQGQAKRKDGLVTLMNERHEPHMVWGFRRGIPIKYTSPALNAQQSSVAIESVVIAHEGAYLLAGGGMLGSAVSEAASAIGGLF